MSLAAVYDLKPLGHLATLGAWAMEMQRIFPHHITKKAASHRAGADVSRYRGGFAPPPGG